LKSIKKVLYRFSAFLIVRPSRINTIQTQIEAQIEHQVPKKRGRKPKQVAEVAEGSTQIGRPPLASKALVNDTEAPKRITRSNSTKQVS
jgi:hypothetical protein